MSWDIELTDPVTGETLQAETAHDMRGGTYVLGGTQELWLNVTYNYSSFYYNKAVFDKQGIKTLIGMTGAESIPVLKTAIKGIKTLPDITPKERAEHEKCQITGYWMPTRDNAERPLHQLLAMAQLRPDGVWDVM